MRQQPMQHACSGQHVFRLCHAARTPAPCCCNLECNETVCTPHVHTHVTCSHATCRMQAEWLCAMHASTCMRAAGLSAALRQISRRSGQRRCQKQIGAACLPAAYGCMPIERLLCPKLHRVDFRAHTTSTSAGSRVKHRLAPPARRACIQALLDLARPLMHPMQQGRDRAAPHAAEP